MIRGLDFIAIPSRDSERSRSFYVDTLGLRPDDCGRFEFWVGQTCFGIWEPDQLGGQFAPQKNAHLALHVNDVAAAKAELEAKGVGVPRRAVRHRGLPHGLLHRPRRQRPDAPPPLRAAGMSVQRPSGGEARPACAPERKGR